MKIATCCPECYGRRQPEPCAPCGNAPPAVEIPQTYALTLNGRPVPGSVTAPQRTVNILLAALNKSGETWRFKR